MNLDRLLKLLKLANHNPNDAEANSAARVASRMLGEDNYKWIEDAKKNGGKPAATPNKINEATLKEWTDPITGDITIKISQLDAHENPKIFDLLKKLKEEIQRPLTWNDVKRSTKPFWRQHSRDQEDYFRKGYYEGVDWDEPIKNPKASSNWCEPVNWEFTWEFTGGRRGEKRTYQQKTRRCTVCNVDRLTGINDEPYVCGECKWKKYQEAKGERNV